MCPRGGVFVTRPGALGTVGRFSSRNSSGRRETGHAVSTSCSQAASGLLFSLLGRSTVHLPARDRGTNAHSNNNLWEPAQRHALKREERREQAHTHTRTHTYRGSEGSKKGRSEVRGGSARGDDTARGHGQVKVQRGEGERGIRGA